MIQGVIFDLGSTLIFFNGDWPAVLQESLRSLTQYLLNEGYEVNEERYIIALRERFERRELSRSKDSVEQPTSKLFLQVMEDFGFHQLSDPFVKTAMEHFFRLSEAQWMIVPGARKVLDELEEEGYRLGLISNAGDERNVLRLLDRGSLRGYFDPIFVSAALGIRKPHREIFHRVLEVWDLPPKMVVMVGDSLKEDILGAQQAGIHQIWCKKYVDTLENRKIAQEIDPEEIADSLMKVPKLVRRMATKG